MKLFRCQCRTTPVLHFENRRCGTCGRLAGFDPASMTLGPWEQDGTGWRVLDATGTLGPRRLLCANRTQHDACNWMVDESEGSPWCRACRRNVMIPDLTVTANLAPWRQLEIAKRRCLFTLMELHVPLDAGDGVPPLAFRFLSDRDSRSNFEQPLPGSEPVLTGHDNGVITINLAEADTLARVRMQVSMAERYRTPLGHFRHESGHYAWDRLAARDAGFADRGRACFGDERSDYPAALNAHYANGPPPDWDARFISAYASAHPFEDWAETWAHYLHIVDTLETQQSYARTLGRQDADAVPLPLDVGDGGAARDPDMERIMARWIEVAIMLNGLNRSMGLPDPYPFVINRAVRDKLAFIHTEVSNLGR